MIHCPHCKREINMGKILVEKRNKGMTKESMKSMMTKASHSTRKYKEKHGLSTQEVA
jgi:hypothetical protein